jgi:hypothetical protein
MADADVAMGGEAAEGKAGGAGDGAFAPTSITVGRGATPADLAPGSIAVVVTGKGVSASFLVWDVMQCARLRGIGRLAATPIGYCSMKVATRGKAAAVPLWLGDEELYVAGLLHDWLTVTDALTGKPFDLRAHMAAVAAVEPGRALKRVVFADLWRNGYRCTSGIKFGVDYLAYTTDPSQVHAEYMIVARPDTAVGACMSPLDLIGRARVATSTLKMCVIAYGNVATGAVRYAAFKRMGTGAAVFLSSSAYLLPLHAVQAAAAANAAAPPPDAPPPPRHPLALPTDDPMGGGGGGGGGGGEEAAAVSLVDPAELAAMLAGS